MTRIFLSSFVAMLLSSPVVAQTTAVYVVTSINQESLQTVEFVSLKRDGSKVRFWRFDVLAPNPKNLFQGNPFTETRSFHEIDCEKDTSRDVEVSFYNKDKIVKRVVMSSVQEHQIIPHTRESQTAYWVCTRGDKGEMMAKANAFESHAEMLKAYERFLSNNP